SGLSSSAAFEVLLGTILSHIYNGGTVNPVNIAQIGQYAENRFFGKPSGLMDQTASAVGGFVGIDFYDEAQPVIKKVDFDFSGAGITLCITDTVGDHADLTGEYAAITLEMREIAGYFGQTLLSRVDEDEFYSKIAELRQYGDRAVLRAAHFFADTRRAKQEKDALQAGDFARFLQLVGESGDSSAGLLQNIYAPGNPREQGLNLALCLSKRVLGGQGACRVHGGGFGGTIQAFVPTDMLPRYKAELEAVFGEGRCHALSVRRAGGIKLRAGRH
ncbi:MAG: galactokinase, partial [Oscillospiraceae bacterium]|nr:galactokinase [Oscillospiraceae bacterium]